MTEKVAAFKYHQTGFGACDRKFAVRVERYNSHLRQLNQYEVLHHVCDVDTYWDIIDRTVSLIRQDISAAIVEHLKRWGDGGERFVNVAQDDNRHNVIITNKYGDYAIISYTGLTKRNPKANAEPGQSKREKEGDLPDGLSKEIRENEKAARDNFARYHQNARYDQHGVDESCSVGEMEK